MAQIYDHRPKGGSIDLSTSGERAAAGLASWYREQENRKEAGRREAAFQQDQERHATEQQIMDMRLEEAQRQHGEAHAVRKAERDALQAEIEDPQGRYHTIVEERLGPKQGAALERMRADSQVPPGAIAQWLDDQGDRFRMQDTMQTLQLFSERAQRVLAHTQGDGDASPAEDQIGVLIESAKADPSDENLRRVTSELHKLEADFNFEQDAFKAWERAQMDLDDAIIAPNATIPEYGKVDYDEYRKVVNQIRSSERWWYDKGPNRDRHITDYAGLLYDAKAYLDHDGERRAENRIGARIKRQQMMREDNPELYARLDPEGKGRVSEREFALALQKEQEAASYQGAAGVPSPGPTPEPTDTAARMQALMQKVEAGDFPPLKPSGKAPKKVLSSLLEMRDSGASVPELQLAMAELGWDFNDKLRSAASALEKSRGAKAEKKAAKAKGEKMARWEELKNVVSLYGVGTRTSGAHSGMKTSKDDDTLTLEQIATREAEKLGLDLTPEQITKFIQWSELDAGRFKGSNPEYQAKQKAKGGE